MFDRIKNNMKEGKIGEGRQAIVQENRVVFSRNLIINYLKLGQVTISTLKFRSENLSLVD